ncbi:MAG: hypothetical protein ACK4MD_09780 [Demequina sp.]
MNLHDELGRHGADAAAESARRLGSSEVRSALGARVRRGRRRRAVGGGVGAVAGVALVAAGVWSVLPGVSPDLGPAGPSVRGGVTYEVDETAPIEKVLPVDLRMPRELQCGVVVQLDEGVTVHEPSVVDAGFAISAAAELVADDGSRYADPTSVWAGYEVHQFVYQASAADLSGVQWYTMPMLLQRGEIVGLGIATGGAGSGAMSMSGPEEAATPLPGSCLEDQLEGLGDGGYEPVLVAQLWSLSLAEPLATVVFSAGDVEYTGLGEAVPDPDPASLPALGTDDYLAGTASVREWSGGLSCGPVLDGVGEGADQGAVVQDPGPVPPVPSWIETGRLYGWGDDVLVGGYPIPLATFGEAWTDTIADRLPVGSDSAARLVLSSDGDYWVFDARWSERGDPENDAPGWFLELSQVWDCGHPDMIGKGTYTAQVLYESVDGERIVDLTPVTVVRGVPSLPEIDAQG